MNIDKIIADELRTCYLDKVEKALKKIGLTFSDLKKCVRVGKSKYGISGINSRYTFPKLKSIWAFFGYSVKEIVNFYIGFGFVVLDSIW